MPTKIDDLDLRTLQLAVAQRENAQLRAQLASVHLEKVFAEISAKHGMGPDDVIDLATGAVTPKPRPEPLKAVE